MVLVLLKFWNYRFKPVLTIKAIVRFILTAVGYLDANLLFKCVLKRSVVVDVHRPRFITFAVIIGRLTIII